MFPLKTGFTVTKKLLLAVSFSSCTHIRICVYVGTFVRPCHSFVLEVNPITVGNFAFLFNCRPGSDLRLNAGSDWKKDFSINEMAGVSVVWPTWVLLLRYSVFSHSTVKSLSLIYLLFITWSICTRRWFMDKLGLFHANQTSICLDPYQN